MLPRHPAIRPALVHPLYSQGARAETGSGSVHAGVSARGGAAFGRVGPIGGAEKRGVDDVAPVRC